jgi:WD40 repeat protein
VADVIEVVMSLLRDWRALVAGLVVGLSGLPNSVSVVAQESRRTIDLPTGAKLRLGNPGVLYRGQPFVTVAPPDYTMLLVPDLSAGIRKFDLQTMVSLDDAPAGQVVSGGQVVVSGDGKRCLTVSTGTLTVRDVTNGQALQQLQLPRRFSTTFTSPIPVVSFSQDGKFLAQGGQSVGGRGEVVVWDIDKGETVFEASLQHLGPPIPVLSPDGKYLATRASTPQLTGKADASSVVTLWQIEGGKELFTGRLTGSATPVTTVAFSPDGRMVAAACGDGPIDLWELPSGKHKYTFFGRTGQGLRVAVSPDSKTLAAVATDGTLQRWNLADGKLIATTVGAAELPLNAAQGLAFGTSDQVIAWGAVGHSPVVWEASSGKLLTPLPEHTAAIRSIAFAAASKEILTAGQDGRVVRWDATTGKPLGSIELRPSRALGISGNRFPVNLSVDGQRALTLVVPHVVFDLATGQEDFVIPRGPVGASTTYSLPSPDAKYVVLITVPQEPRKTVLCTVWDLVARKKLMQFDQPPGGRLPPAVAISPEGNRMVMAAYVPNPGSGQLMLRVTGWDLRTGTKLGEIDDVAARGTLAVTAVSEALAVVASGGGRLRVFNYETGQAGDELEIVNRSDTFTQIVFSPTHKQFAVGASSLQQGGDVVRVHDWPSGRLRHTFTGHQGQVTALVFSPDGKTLASGSQDGIVYLWDLSRGTD